MMLFTFQGLWNDCWIWVEELEEQLPNFQRTLGHKNTLTIGYGASTKVLNAREKVLRLPFVLYT